MPRLSMTDFLDLVHKSGTTKATKINDVMHRGEYDPATDFYRAVRLFLIDVHKNSPGKKSLDSFLKGVFDLKKKANYPGVISGYRKWWGKKDLTWFTPHVAMYGAHDVEISVNPELGLIIDGAPHLVKLYFKEDKLTKQRVEIITHLMELALRPKCSGEPVRMSVLDIRRSKIFSPSTPIEGLSAMIDAELAYVASYWRSLQG